jgi:serine phosphatase RsbU (regulator of sigma subunit)
VGGDWWSADAPPEEALWIIVADVTGHGYAAHLVAAGLPFLWQARQIVGMRSGGLAPEKLLNALGRELEQVLPDGIFVEAVIGRFTSDGQVCASGAGNCRVAVKRSGERQIYLDDFGGYYLGLELGDREQREWSLDTGDELMLASDGLHEQPCGENARLKTGLTVRVETSLASGRDLHDSVLDALDDALRVCPQCDDITIVTVSLRSAPAHRGGVRVAM